MSKINVSVDCVIFGFDNEEKKLKVLLIKKKINPYDKKNSGKQIALPGDLIRLEEDIDESAKRVLFSLTKLNNVFLRQFKTFGDPKRVQSSKDQEWLKNFRQEPGERVITVGYVSLVRMEDYMPYLSNHHHFLLYHILVFLEIHFSYLLHHQIRQLYYLQTFQLNKQEDMVTPLHVSSNFFCTFYELQEDMHLDPLQDMLLMLLQVRSLQCKDSLLMQEVLEV